jgi:hypothetical protein
MMKPGQYGGKVLHWRTFLEHAPPSAASLLLDAVYAPAAVCPQMASIWLALFEIRDYITRSLTSFTSLHCISGADRASRWQETPVPVALYLYLAPFFTCQLSNPLAFSAFQHVSA